mgnify:CR=1 FL=1
MPPGTRTRRKKADPPPVFQAVHAASMSTPVFAGMVAEFGEPNLNPQEPFDWSEPEPWLAELLHQHRPSFIPDWAGGTSQYLIDRKAYDNYVDRLNGEKEVQDEGQ